MVCYITYVMLYNMCYVMYICYMTCYNNICYVIQHMLCNIRYNMLYDIC